MNQRFATAVDDDESPRQRGYVADLPNYPKKNLPYGTWVCLRNVPVEATEEDIRQVILERTGVDIPVDAICQNAFSPTRSGAMISFGKHAVNALVAWALSEAEIHGRPIEVAPPMKSAKW